MDIFVKDPGPLALVNFSQPWSSKFQNFDIFFDQFSNLLIFHNEGYFVIWDEYHRTSGQGKIPFTLHLAGIYKQIYALCVHPSKNCIAMQVGETQINLLFLKEKQAEEVKMNFQKAKKILGFSFVFGEDFNLFVATNTQIDLYDVSISKQRAKLIKSITFTIQEGHSELFYDPLANVAVICDTQKGCVHPFFLNLHKNRNYKGKVIQLDADLSHSQNNQDNLEDDVQGSKAQSTMNATASIAGGSSVAQLQNSISQGIKTSFSQKALSFFKGTTQTFTNIQVASGTFNKNLKQYMNQNEENDEYQNEDFVIQGESQKQNKKKGQKGQNEKRNKHQIFVTSLYNKSVMLHLCPQTGDIFIHELDPNITFKYNLSISIQRGDSLYHMQVIDNLIVVHNIDQKSTNIYDIKLAEYNLPICQDNLDIDTQYAQEFYHSDQIFNEEIQALNDVDNVGIETETEDKFQSDPYSASKIQNNKQSKEYLEVNFQFNYSGGDDSPISIGIDVNSGQSQIEKSKMQIDRLDQNKSLNNQKGKSVDVYDIKTIIFIEPMFLIDAKTFRSFTMKISLEKLIQTQRNMCRQAICLLNRTNNKQLFLQYLTSLLVNKKLNLFSVSMIFMKICQVYKQASLERQSIRKRAQQMTSYQKVLQNYEAKLDQLILQHQRLGRLRANTSFNTNSLNNFLTENAPNGKVLSGEIIIFQNEIQDTFRKLINMSDCILDQQEADYLKLNSSNLIMNLGNKRFKSLSCRYCLSIIEEYNRCLMEHQIPQSPSQQAMLIQYILKQKEYRLLQSLVQYHVLSDSLELARILIEIGSKDMQNEDVEKYYEPAFQMGLDMLQRLKKYDEIVVALINEGYILKSLDYALDYNVHSMRLTLFQQVIEQLKLDGDELKANMIQKRVNDIRRFDEIKSKDPNYKSIIN